MRKQYSFEFSCLLFLVLNACAEDINSSRFTRENELTREVASEMNTPLPEIIFIDCFSIGDELIVVLKKNIISRCF